MSEEFGSDYITLVDENGEEFELEFLDEMDYNGKTYAAFLPTDLKEDDPDYGLVLLIASEDENGEQVYDTIDDDEELDDVYQHFMILLFDDEEDE